MGGQEIPSTRKRARKVKEWKGRLEEVERGENGRGRATGRGGEGGSSRAGRVKGAGEEEGQEKMEGGVGSGRTSLKTWPMFIQASRS